MTINSKWVETGVYYYGARYYDPKISACLVVKRTRWLSADPLAEKYTSLSSYVFSANSPLNIIDPDGRRIWVVTNETWEIISDGIRGLFGDQTPFLRDTESGKMLINPEFDASNLEPAQQELYNRYASLIENDNVDAYVQAVGYDEVFSDHAGREQSLSSEGELAYGRTFDDFFEDEEAGIQEHNIYIYIARDPHYYETRKYGASPINPFGFTRRDKRASVNPNDDRGMASIHEIGGHAYLYSLGVIGNENYERTERFETAMRSVFKRMFTGTIMGGKAQKH